MAAKRYHPFPNTHWSLVHRAGFADETTRRAALTILLERYEPALMSYLTVVRNMTDDSAAELFQEFIADKVLEYELLRHAQEGRGRFRTFLLTSLNHFAIGRFRKANRSRTIPLDPTGMDEPSSTTTPTVEVETAWAKSLIHAVLANMRKECEATGRADVWMVFESRILTELFEGKSPPPYEELANTLGLSSPTQASNLLITGKRMYARLLRAAVAEYESSNADIESEIADLHRALNRPSMR